MEYLDNSVLEDFKNQVLLEAKNIKLHATKKEIDRLDFNQLDGNDSNLCIYGQMTLSCYSNRALKLLKLCAKPYSTTLGFISLAQYDEYTDENLSNFGFRYFSHIEFYICQPLANSKGLIEFIKREITEADLKL